MAFGQPARPAPSRLGAASEGFFYSMYIYSFLPACFHFVASPNLGTRAPVLGRSAALGGDRGHHQALSQAAFVWSPSRLLSPILRAQNGLHFACFVVLHAHACLVILHKLRSRFGGMHVSVTVHVVHLASLIPAPGSTVFGSFSAPYSPRIVSHTQQRFRSFHSPKQRAP